MIMLRSRTKNAIEKVMRLSDDLTTPWFGAGATGAPHLAMLDQMRKLRDATRTAKRLLHEDTDGNG